MLQDLAIFGAGMWAGAINVLVGSGALVTFPTLLFLGYPPLVANVSNNIGVVAGGFSGIYGYRRELRPNWPFIRALVPASLLGGVVGAPLVFVLPAVNPMIFGDLKPDYVDLIREAYEAADRLTGAARQQVLADAHGRKLTMVGALITILRAEPPTDREETIIDRALKTPRRHPHRRPVLGDLLKDIQDAPEDLRHVALDRGDINRYRDITEGLEATLIGLTSGGRLGDIFSKQTSVAMKRDRPVVFDISSIDDSESDLQAAVMLA